MPPGEIHPGVMAISLGGRLLDPSSGLPGSRSRAGPARGNDRLNGVSRRIHCSLFDLAPGGVCLARLVTQPAGELLPHRFTLTAWACAHEAVCFLLHFPWPHGRWALPITMSCGARTFLSPGPLLEPIWRPQRVPGQRPSGPLRTLSSRYSLLAEFPPPADPANRPVRTVDTEERKIG